MDEILGRWASDLSKYQSDFKDQAEKVAQWDRLMVDNGEKIQKLYNATFNAEKDSAEIERQLANVESQQDELAAWLDRYESDVDEMFTRQVGQGETLQGPDQERERTYKLAEKLTDRLDDMGKNLTSMIDAINEASTTLTKTNKADDPVSTP
jgi:nuclear pore complex protein Nup62